MTGMGMPPAPIMGSRKRKLLQATRETIIMTRKMQAEYCKRFCGDRSPEGTTRKDRDHLMLCLRTTIKMQAIDALMRGI